MAPMTRNRAGRRGVPTQMNALYYAQRATAGMIITEATQPTADGQGYPDTPGLHTRAQQHGWSVVADAVHAKGGLVAVQLMHAGRISHCAVQPGGRVPVAPSAVRPEGRIYTSAGMLAYETPRPLDAAGIRRIVRGFADGAVRARAAGLDAVEIHAGNGYLLHQFLAANTNRRSDAYGGSPVRRTRAVVEVVEEVADRIGADRVGLRVSPGGTVNDIDDDQAVETHLKLIDQLTGHGLAWLHVVESPATAGFSAIDEVRRAWPGVLVGNGSFDRCTAAAAIAAGRADAISFGSAFAANPDLPRRLLLDAPLAAANRSTFYGGGHQGYTDYPALKRFHE